MTSFSAPPPGAAWRHREARDGFEVVFFAPGGDGLVAQGSTCAVEAGRAWTVTYRLALDARWRTRRAEVTNRTSDGERRVVLEHDGRGEWLVDGRRAGALRGCQDVDLESSALTNAFPVHRLGLGTGERAEAPAAYVRAVDLGVSRLEQTYRCREGGRYDYAAPMFGFRCELTYDAFGLLLTYPGIAERVH